jgi:hypothetical protein
VGRFCDLRLVEYLGNIRKIENTEHAGQRREGGNGEATPKRRRQKTALPYPLKILDDTPLRAFPAVSVGYAICLWVRKGQTSGAGGVGTVIRLIWGEKL